MTRDERIQAAEAAARETAPRYGDEADCVAILDAALADLGGLDGLVDLTRDLAGAEASRDAAEAQIAALIANGKGATRQLNDMRGECDALRADRDRLREALMFAARGDDSNSTASKAWLAARLRSVAERAREALRDSEAGTKC